MKDSAIVIMTVLSVFVLIGGFALYSAANQGFPCSKYAHCSLYIDYGSHENETAQSGWVYDRVESKKSNPLKVLRQHTDLKMDKKGNIISINGIAPDSSAGEKWAIWEVDYFTCDNEGKYNENGVWTAMDSTIEKARCWTLYIGLVCIDPVTNSPSTNPYDKGIETPYIPCG